MIKLKVVRRRTPIERDIGRIGTLIFGAALICLGYYFDYIKTYSKSNWDFVPFFVSFYCLLFLTVKISFYVRKRYFFSINNEGVLIEKNKQRIIHKWEDIKSIGIANHDKELLIEFMLDNDNTETLLFVNPNFIVSPYSFLGVSYNLLRISYNLNQDEKVKRAFHERLDKESESFIESILQNY